MSTGLGALADVAARSQGGSIEPGPDPQGFGGRKLEGDFFIDPTDGRVKNKPANQDGASVTPPAAGGDKGGPPRQQVGEKAYTEEELSALIANSVPKDDFTRLRQKDNQHLDQERQKIREELEKEYAPLRDAKQTFDSLPAHVRDHLMKKNLAGVMSEGQAENRFVELMKDIDPQSAEGRAVDTLGRALTAQIQENERLQKSMGDFEGNLSSQHFALAHTVLSLQAKELAADLKAEGIDFPREQQRFLIKALINNGVPISEETVANAWRMVSPGKAAELERKRGASTERRQIESAASGSTTPGGTPAAAPAGTGGITKEDAVRYLENRFPDRAGSGRVNVPFQVG